MKIERVRIRRVAGGEDAAAWTAALADPAWMDCARVLKLEGAAWVRRASLTGRDVAVKCRPLHTLSRRLKAALRLGHADKQWRGADLLSGAGIATGRPLCAGTARVGGRACELLALEFVPGATALEVLAGVTRGTGPPVRTQHQLAAVAGGSVARLVASRLHNADHKPSNLVIHGDVDPQIAVIDCVGVGTYSEDSFEFEEMLAALVIEPAGCGCAVRGALWMRGLLAAAPSGIARADAQTRRRWARSVASRVRGIIQAHGDPTPKVNPLAAPVQAPNRA